MLNFSSFTRTLTVLLTSSFFLESSVKAMVSEDSEPRATPIQRLKDGDHEVFTSSLTLKSGEAAYFGFEPIINEDRSKKWETYADFADRLSQTDRGFLHVLSGFIRLNQNLDIVKENTPQTVIDQLQAKNDLRKFQNALGAVSSGALGMHHSVGTYISYVSKKPITGFFPFATPVSWDAVEVKDRIQHHINHYDDLVMSVSSYYSGPKNTTYEHRGIFRNPMSMVRNDYKGLALLIHSFTGAARSMQDPKLAYMIVDPNANWMMQSLLLGTFNSEEMYAGTVNFDYDRYRPFKGKFTPEKSQEFIEKAGFKPDKLAIELQALKSRFPVAK